MAAWTTIAHVFHLFVTAVFVFWFPPWSWNSRLAMGYNLRSWFNSACNGKRELDPVPLSPFPNSRKEELPVSRTIYKHCYSICSLLYKKKIKRKYTCAFNSVGACWESWFSRFWWLTRAKSKLTQSMNALRKLIVNRAGFRGMLEMWPNWVPSCGGHC